MKKIAFLAAFALTASSAFAAFSGRVQIDNNAYQNGSGGEFLATPLSGFVGITGTASDLSATTFQTFCVQTAEHLSFGGQYDANINTSTVLGNVPLAPEVAYLYTAFRNGTLDATAFGAAATYFSAQRQTQAGILQEAIWGYMLAGPTNVNNPYYKLANNAISTGAWSGIGNVRILSLFNGPGQDANGNNQDVLTMIPAPGAALLGLIGLAGVRWFRRKTA